MKKLMKKIAVPVLSLAMLLGTTAVPAFAAANGIQTYGMPCPECNRGEIVLTSSWDSQEKTLAEYDCPKNKMKKDTLVYYVHYASWACTYCGQGDTSITPHQELRCNH